MFIRKQLYILFTLMSASCWCPSVSAAQVTDTVAVDSVKTEAWYRRMPVVGPIVRYFDDTDKHTTSDKAFDISFIGGPHYNSETKLGLGLMAAGLYRMDRSDTLAPPSQVGLYGDISTSGFYLLGIKGYNIWPRDRYRLNYKVYFYSMKDRFWGIGYHRGSCYDDYVHYTRFYAKMGAEFLVRLYKGVYVGPAANFQFTQARKVTPDALPLWEGQDLILRSWSIGATAAWDTRDLPSAPSRGLYIKLEDLLYPKLLNSRYFFNALEVTMSYYHGLWKGATLAVLGHARFTQGHTPWAMLSTFGGSDNMRGYYEGQYRSKNVIDACVELRQHLWARNGIVLWVGAGEVFPTFSRLVMRHVLPNAGVGYRWRFKKGVNVRLDFGVGKHSTAFVFSINEAF